MADDDTHNFGQAPLSCEICDGTDNVTWNCVDCKANLCVKCYNDHFEGKPVRLFKNHKIVPIEEALRSTFFEEYCAMHPGSVCILNCNTCRQLVCISCVTGPHKGHEHCKIENAITKTFQDMTHYQEIIQHSLLPQCSNLDGKIKENISECEDWYTKHKNQLQRKRKELKTEVDRHCDELLQTMTIQNIRSKEIAEEDKIRVEAKKTELKKLLQTTTETMKKIRNPEMNQLTKVIEDITLPTVNPIQLPTYVGKQIDGLQVVQTYITPDDQQAPYSNTEEYGDGYKALPRDGTYEESRQKRHDVSPGKKEAHQGKSLEQAPIIDIQILSRHKLKDSVDSIETNNTNTAWINTLNRKELKRVNMKGEGLGKIENKYGISNFKIMTNGYIISSHSEEKCLQVLSGTGVVITKINTDPYRPSGICLTKDGQLVAVCLYREDMTSILQVYTTDGQLVQTVDYTGRKSPEYKIQRVTTNESADYCVVHRGLCTVFVISNTGSLRFTYDGSTAPLYTGTFHPRDIVRDRYNHLLISDMHSNTVHMLDKEGQFLRYLLTFTQNVIVHPKGLSLDSEGKLWVGQEDGMLLVVMYFKKYDQF